MTRLILLSLILCACTAKPSRPHFIIHDPNGPSGWVDTIPK